MKYRALGVTCGIGSMLVGAKQAGFEIVGNIEWRKYYHTGTFEYNFPGAFMVKKIDELTSKQFENIKGIDLVMGHPDCGNFSQLTSTCKNYKNLYNDPADIPLFVDIIKKLQPRYFVMDDLPKSLIAYDIQKYSEKLSAYDLFPEWISNYYYGNLQLKRDRFWIIGALKGESYVFVPGEIDNERSVKEIIGDLPDYDIEKINHIHVNGSRLTSFRSIYEQGKKLNYNEVAKQFLNFKSGANVYYISNNGSIKKKPGYYRVYEEKHSHVINGGENAFHYKTGLPLTCRERARIQGCPDEFIFVLEDQCGAKMTKQTGKFMPVEFCKYVSEQIYSWIKHEDFHTSGKRLVKSNKYIDEAKKWYCKNVGYFNQKEVCNVCWLKGGLGLC